MTVTHPASSLRSLSEAGARTVYGVFLFSRALRKHLVDDYDTYEDALEGLAHTRRVVDASALLVSRVEIVGPWSLAPTGVDR